MDTRSRYLFLALILGQAAHSVEEYAFRLYDVFAPARLVSSLVSDDLTVGFAVVNAAIVLFGAWCYAARVRPGHPAARRYAWFWVLLEAGNGAGHPLLSLARGALLPGTFTAPVLLVLSVLLGVRLVRVRPPARRPA